MKKLFIILLFVFPLFCKAQKDTCNVSLLTAKEYMYNDTTPITFLTKSNYDVGSSFSISTWEKQKVSVFGEKGQMLATIDTAGNLKVYGDTLSVLLAIFNSFSIKVNRNE